MPNFNRPELGATVLITGAAGFIGFHLAQRLLGQGVRVVGFDNLNDYYEVSLKESRLAILRESPGFEFVRGDLSDMDAVTRLFEAHQPQIVVHLAAQAGVRYSIENPRVYIDSNIVGFFNVLEACRKFPVEHLLYASSSSVYGNQEKVPFSTDDPVDTPISLYAATKKSNELMAYTYSHLFGIPTTGLRFFTVYGPYGRPDMAIFTFTRKILAGEPIPVFVEGELYRDYTYVDDIVTGIENILANPPVIGPKYALYNIGNNSPVQTKRLIELLEKCLGMVAEKNFLPMQPGDVTRTYADVGPLQRDFDFRPDTPLEVGLERFVQWYRAYYAI